MLPENEIPSTLLKTFQAEALRRDAEEENIRKLALEHGYALTLGQIQKAVEKFRKNKPLFKSRRVNGYNIFSTFIKQKCKFT